MTRNASQAVFGGVLIEAVCCVFCGVTWHVGMVCRRWTCTWSWCWVMSEPTDSSSSFCWSSGVSQSIHWTNHFDQSISHYIA